MSIFLYVFNIKAWPPLWAANCNSGTGNVGGSATAERIISKDKSSEDVFNNFQTTSLSTWQHFFPSELHNLSFQSQPYFCQCTHTQSKYAYVFRVMNTLSTNRYAYFIVYRLILHLLYEANFNILVNFVKVVTFQKHFLVR